MTELINIYCDESCHLENDQHRSMVLGALWCPAEKTKEISIRLRELKAANGMNPRAEVKWRKVSPAGADLYTRLVDYFFDDDDLHFRALVVPDKSLLNHGSFSQDHDTWYFTMYFDLLKVVLKPSNQYRIYLDVKDTKSAVRVRELHDVLANNMYDFDRSIVERVQTVRSHEVELMQLSDLLIGATSYANRQLSGNAGKAKVVERIRDRSHYSLTKTTLIREEKTNFFVCKAMT